MRSPQYQLDIQPYARPFQRPLVTHHGRWPVREGLLLKLTRLEDQQVGFGEVAPLPHFGSETMAEALTWLRSHCQNSLLLSDKTRFQVPDALPACQFALEAAWENLICPAVSFNALRSCQLLPTGVTAMTSPIIRETARDPVLPPTFKWKIGVEDPNLEMDWFRQLVTQLPPGSRLRLDANGGLDRPTAERWLAECDRLPGSSITVDCLEQPLPPDQLDPMLRLDQQFRTPIALDESVATLQHLLDCYGRGWRGLWVIKPAIAGSPQRLRQICRDLNLDVIWSSALETPIGQRFITTRLIPSIAEPTRAIGFGIDHWFRDNHLGVGDEQIWQQLSMSRMTCGD